RRRRHDLSRQAQAERRGDQLELAGISRDVAGGEDPGAVGAHRAVHLDRAAHDVDPPVFYRTQRVAEADVDQHRLHFQGLLFFTTIVIDSGPLDTFIAADGL